MKHVNESTLNHAYRILYWLYLVSKILTDKRDEATRRNKDRVSYQKTKIKVVSIVLCIILFDNLTFQDSHL